MAGLIPKLLVAAGLAVTALSVAPAPAGAQAATAQQQQAAADFITRLSDEAFGVLRDTSLSREQARQRFRELLRRNFAVEQTGMRLIRRWRAPNSPIQLTQAQIDAYRAALPDYLVNTYSDRLYDFASARVQVVRSVPRGSRGDVDVITRITDPRGGRPVDATWHVGFAGQRPMVTNLTVNGINVALTQEADFNAFVERNGFDALIAFLRRPAGQRA